MTSFKRPRKLDLPAEAVSLMEGPYDKLLRRAVSTRHDMLLQLDLLMPGVGELPAEMQEICNRLVPFGIFRNASLATLLFDASEAMQALRKGVVLATLRGKDDAVQASVTADARLTLLLDELQYQTCGLTGKRVTKSPPRYCVTAELASASMAPGKPAYAQLETCLARLPALDFVLAWPPGSEYRSDKTFDLAVEVIHHEQLAVPVALLEQEQVLNAESVADWASLTCLEAPSAVDGPSRTGPALHIRFKGALHPWTVDRLLQSTRSCSHVAIGTSASGSTFSFVRPPNRMKCHMLETEADR